MMNSRPERKFFYTSVFLTSLFILPQPTTNREYECIHKFMHKCVCGCEGAWMNVCVNGKMDGFMCGRMYIGGRMDVWVDGCIGLWIDGCVNGWIWMDEWIHGWIYE